MQNQAGNSRKNFEFFMNLFDKKLENSSNQHIGYVDKNFSRMEQSHIKNPDVIRLYDGVKSDRGMTKGTIWGLESNPTMGRPYCEMTPFV